MTANLLTLQRQPLTIHERGILKPSVGILTYHNVLNFGAVLQAFALQRTVQSFGHTCTIVDFASPVHGTSYNLFDWRPNHFTSTRRLYSSARRNYRVMANLRSHLLVRERFAKFRSYHLVMTSNTYHSAIEVAEKSPAFDAYVVGSDQVWEPSGLDRGSGSVYFLEFVSAGRRVAYAPSFGLAEMPSEFRDRIATLISRFDFLSAREDSGCRIIQELTGRKAAHVLDPSMLLPAADYERVAVTPPHAGHFVLLYPMLSSEGLKIAARSAAKSLKLPLVAIVPIYYDPREYAFADHVVFDAGPSEFLGWMSKAAFVCTNSFHGLAFSLVFRKPFLTVPYHIESYNLRPQSLLSALGLLDRQMDSIREFIPDDPLLAPVDYTAVESRLESAIVTSINYLKQALV